MLIKDMFSIQKFAHYLDKTKRENQKNNIYTLKE